MADSADDYLRSRVWLASAVQAVLSPEEAEHVQVFVRAYRESVSLHRSEHPSRVRTRYARTFRDVFS